MDDSETQCRMSEYHIKLCELSHLKIQKLNDEQFYLFISGLKQQRLYIQKKAEIYTPQPDVELRDIGFQGDFSQPSRKVEHLTVKEANEIQLQLCLRIR